MAVPEWNELRALNALGIARVPFHHANGNCQGYATGRDVAVSPIAFLPHRTLFHELAHIVLGHTAESMTLADGEERTPRASSRRLTQSSRPADLQRFRWSHRVLHAERHCSAFSFLYSILE
jgi:hypothetical protein